MAVKKHQTTVPDGGKGGGTSIRDRIRELRRIRVADLQANPLNWRAHPESQQAAMSAVLREIGMVDALLVRDAGEGVYEIIDGHLRASLLPHDEVPCLVLDVSPEEARKILLTFDPLGSMAEANAANLDALLREAEFGEAALQELVAGLAEDAGLYVDDAGSAGAGSDAEGESSQYTNKIEAPIYEPKGEKPPISDLFDKGKTNELCQEIERADIPSDVKQFLTIAAQRHTVFNFRNIAEFYCHASAEVQHLMERSGLIIIDMDKAIQNGFVHLSERLGAIADIELSERENGNA